MESFKKKRAVNLPLNENGSILIPRIIPKNDDSSTMEESRHHKDHQMKPRKKVKMWVKILLGFFGFLVVTLIVTGVLVYDLYRKGLVLKTSLQELKDSAKLQNIQIIKEGVPKVKTSLVEFEKSYKRLAFAKALPYIGTYYTDGIHGLTAATHSIDAGMILITTVEPYADIIGFSPNSEDTTSADQNAQQRIDFIIKTIPDLLPKMDELSDKFLLIKTELDEVDPTDYPEKLRGVEVQALLKNSLEQFGQVYTLMENAKPMLEVAPYILGSNGTREYLVLFQNDKELRPTGGFITAYSIAKVANGRFEPVSSDDIYNLDNQYKPHIKAPDPIVKFLKAPYTTSPFYRLRDINWDPDFSDSMETFLKEAKTAKLPNVDGIIAVDTQVLVNLLDVIGPIGVAGFGEFSTKIIPECNCPQVIYELESFADVEGAVVWSENEPGKIVFAPPNYENRKKIIGPLMNSVLANTLGQPKEKMPALFEAMFKSLIEKHILFYFTDVKTQKATELFGIAGTFKDVAESDFLSIIDANLGGRKSNLYVVQDVAQELVIDKSGGITKTLTITYKNTEKQDGWLNSVLPNWVRVYVPKGSELISFDGLETKVDPYEEHGKTVYAGSFQLRPLGVSKVTVKYKIPVKFKDYYKIYIQKQPGKDTSLHTFTIGRTEEEYDISTDKEIRIKI